MPTAVVTGGLGFLGSHLCAVTWWLGVGPSRLGQPLTGNADDTRDLLDRGRFTQVIADVCDGIDIAAPIDAVLHLASPASPGDYLAHPLETLKVGSIGTISALELALRNDARFLLASTSEIYGDSARSSSAGDVLGQREPRWSEVRLRRGEAVLRGACDGVPPHARPRRQDRSHLQHVWPRDAPGRRPGHPNFVHQALNDLPLTVFGDGSQLDPSAS